MRRCSSGTLLIEYRHCRCYDLCFPSDIQLSSKLWLAQVRLALITDMTATVLYLEKYDFICQLWDQGLARDGDQGLARDGIAEPNALDQILRHTRRECKKHGISPAQVVVCAVQLTPSWNVIHSRLMSNLLKVVTAHTHTHTSHSPPID